MSRSIYVSIFNDKLLQIEDDEAELLDMPRPRGSAAVMVEFGSTKVLVVMRPDQAISEARDWGRRLLPIDGPSKRPVSGVKMKEVLQDDASNGEVLVDAAAGALWLTLSGGNQEFSEDFISQGDFMLIYRLTETPEGLRHLAEVGTFD